MRSKLTFVLAVLSTISLSCAAADLKISGRVIDQSGAPVPGAIVSAKAPQGNETVSVITDNSGKFAIPSTTETQVSAWKKGYKSPASQSVTKDSAGKMEVKLESVPVVPVSQLSTSDILPYLPSDPNKDTFVASCYACHGFSKMLADTQPEDGWLQTVQKMESIAYDSGLTGSDKRRAQIVDYLSKYLGENSTLPADIGKKVKDNYKPPVPIGHDIVFTEYQIPTPNALSHTAVPDKKGHVWFTEYLGRKIGRLDIATGEIKEFPLDTPGVGAHGITVGADGVVWFTGIPFIIGKIDPVTLEKTEYKVPLGKNGNPPGPHTIIEAKDGTIWFNELLNHSLTHFNPRTKEFKRYDLQPNETAYGILEKEPNILWYCLVQPGAIGTLNANTGEMKSFPIPTPNSGAQRFRFDNQGRLWFGEFHGQKIGMFDPSTQKFQEYELPYRGSPYSVYIDAKQNVWAGSYDRDSLIKFDPDTKQMTEYPLPGVSAIIRDIWPDEHGKMWFSQWFRNKVTSAEIVQ